MLRIIPPKAKASYNIYKNLTIFDFILLFFDLLIITLIFSTIFPLALKIILGVIVLAIGITAITTLVGTKKGYMYFYNMILFLIRNKNKPETKIVDDLKIEFTNNYIKNDSKLSSIIEITGIDFGILTGDKQDFIIDSIQKVYKDLKEAKIFKLNKPISLEKYLIKTGNKSEQWLKKFSENEDEDIQAQCLARIGILENVAEQLKYNHDEKSFLANTFYLIIYDTDEERLLSNTINAVESFLNVGLDAKQLKENELIEVYNLFYDTNDLIIPSMKEKHASLMINEEEWCVGSFTNLPFQVGNAWAWRLFSIPNTKVVLDFSLNQDTQQVVKSINRSMKEYEARYLEKGISASTQLDIETQYQALQNLLMAVKLGNEMVHNVNLYIMYKKEDLKLVNETFRSEGIFLDRLFHNQFESYLAMQPYNLMVSKYNKYEVKNFQTSVLSAMFPFVSHPFLDDDGDYLGYGEHPVFFDLFDNLGHKHKSRVNANMVILGKSGSGKSFFTKKLMMQQACNGTKIFILDPDNEYDYLSRQLCGNWIDLGAVSSNKCRINPFEIFPSLADDTEGENGELDATKSFLEQFFQIVAPNLDNEARSILNKCITNVYAKFNIYSYTDIKTLTPNDYPTMDDLYSEAENWFKKADNEYDKTMLRKIMNMLEDFKKGGSKARLWNGATTLELTNDFTVLNFQSLFANSNSVIANGQMLLVMRFLNLEIMKNKANNLKNGTNNRIIIAIDEAHRFINAKFPVALDFMSQMVKQIRKYNGSMLVATQNIADFIGREEATRTQASNVINGCQYTALFGLNANDITSVTELYKNYNGGLTKPEIDALSNANNGDALFLIDANTRFKTHIDLYYNEQAIIENLG